MHLMRVWMAFLAIAMLVLSITLAEGNGVVDILANISPASEFVIDQGTVVLSNPPSGQIGTWTGKFGLDFLENGPNALLAQGSNGGLLTSPDGNMKNQIQINGVSVSGSSTDVQERFTALGEITMDLPISQEVTYNDPAGNYAGEITLTLSPYYTLIT